MTTKADEHIAAYEAGEKKMDANAVKTPVENLVDGSSPIGTMGIPPAVAPIITTGLKPGQFRAHYNTSVYNPLRSSPEVEAILGEKKYNPKREGPSRNSIMLELEEERRKRGALEIKVDAFMAGKSAKDVIVQPKDMEWSQLRTTAKKKGINTKGLSKDKIVEELNKVI